MLAGRFQDQVVLLHGARVPPRWLERVDQVRHQFLDRHVDW